MFDVKSALFIFTLLNRTKKRIIEIYFFYKNILKFMVVQIQMFLVSSISFFETSKIIFNSTRTFHRRDRCMKLHPKSKKAAGNAKIHVVFYLVNIFEFINAY